MATAYKKQDKIVQSAQSTKTYYVNVYAARIYFGQAAKRHTHAQCAHWVNALKKLKPQRAHGFISHDARI
jgi:hypothetical protein